MTSIEFIDREITSYKQLAILSENDEKKHYEECITILQQIKSQLESCEEIKPANETICDVKPADVSYETYRKLQHENEALKDAIVKLTLKLMLLERQLHSDI